MTTGFVLINKPKGMTSHDVVDKLREITNVKKIGHAGTLDPFATGLLILGIGRESTKRLSLFLKKDKEYLAKIRLGAVSDTYDVEGNIFLIDVKKKPSEKEVQDVLNSFLGRQKQVSPMFSAKKIKGRKLYELAREGKSVKVNPKEIEIYKIKLLRYAFPFLEIRVGCSAGTYIRSLAYDIGKKLGCGGYLEELCRTRIGNLYLKDGASLSEISAKNWKNFLKRV